MLSTVSGSGASCRTHTAPSLPQLGPTLMRSSAVRSAGGESYGSEVLRSGYSVSASKRGPAFTRLLCVTRSATPLTFLRMYWPAAGALKRQRQRLQVAAVAQTDVHDAGRVWQRHTAASDRQRANNSTISQDLHGLAFQVVQPGERGDWRAVVGEATVDENASSCAVNRRDCRRSM